MRVIVVGGGVMGAASARALARRGARVTLLERFAFGHRRGSSHGRARIFRLAYAEDHFVALAAKALDGWRELERETGAAVLTQTGSVDHGDPADIAALARALEQAGIAFDRLSPAAAEARWPGLRFDREVIAHAEAGRVDAEAATQAFLASAREAGVDAREGVRVDAVREGAVVAGGEKLAADVVVLATNAWTPQLAPFALPPVAVTIEQPVHFDARVPDGWPSFIHYRSDGLPLYGLAEPGSGVKLGEHGGGPPFDPEDEERPVDPERVERLAAYAREWMPGVDAASARPQPCLYASTPTTDPIIDRRGDVVVACGFSGHGFKFAPAIGDLVADLAHGATAPPQFSLDHRPT